MLTEVNNTTFNRIIFRREVLKDLFYIIGLFLLTVFFVYYAPSIARDIFFLVLLGIFYKSNKNYFWFAYLFVIINSPAYFWHSYELNSPYRLAIYSIPGGGSFTINDLFVITAFIKYLLYKKVRPVLPIVKLVIPLYIFVLILGTFTAIFFETGIKDFFSTFRGYFYFSLLFTLPGLINGKYDIMKMGYLISPFILLILADQIYTVVNMTPLLSLISPAAVKRMYHNYISGEVRPIMGGVLVVFYAFTFAFALLRNKKFEIFRFAALSIIGVSIIIFFVSATRTWMTISVVMIFLYLYFNKKIVKTTVFFPLVTATFLGLIIILNLTDYVMDNIVMRYLGFLQSLMGGNVTNYDTVGYRVEFGLPKLMEGISISPIFGLGFSKIQVSYYNSDFGALNTILTIGIVGFAFLMVTYLLVLKRIYYHVRQNYSRLANSILEAVFSAFVAIMIAYLLNWDFFTFTSSYKVFFITLLFANVEIAIRLKDEGRQSLSDGLLRPT